MSATELAGKEWKSEERGAVHPTEATLKISLL